MEYKIKPYPNANTKYSLKTNANGKNIPLLTTKTDPKAKTKPNDNMKIDTNMKHVYLC